MSRGLEFGVPLDDDFRESDSYIAAGTWPGQGGSSLSGTSVRLSPPAETAREETISYASRLAGQRSFARRLLPLGKLLTSSL